MIFPGIAFDLSLQFSFVSLLHGHWIFTNRFDYFHYHCLLQHKILRVNFIFVFSIQKIHSKTISWESCEVLVVRVSASDWFYISLLSILAFCWFAGFRYASRCIFKLSINLVSLTFSARDWFVGCTCYWPDMFQVLYHLDHPVVYCLYYIERFALLLTISRNLLLQRVETKNSEERNCFY